MENMMRMVFALFLLTLGTSSAQAQTARIDRIVITDAGIYTTKVMGDKNAPNTAVGIRKNVKDIKLAVSTTEVPAQLNAHFGFFFTPLGEPAGQRSRSRA
jgi:hypothetical protein